MMAEDKDRLGDIKAVLFDMDGLLIDSEIVYTIVVNKILAPYGKEQTWEIKSKLMGTPERKATEILLSSLWPPSPEEKQNGQLFSHDCPFTIDSFLQDRNMDLDDYFSKVKPMPGAQRLVQHLAKHDVPICIATGSKRRNYEIKSSNNQALFRPFGDRVICGDDPRIERGKPTPDVFLLAAREGLGMRQGVREVGAAHDNTFGGQERHFLVFEDAKPGVQAAKAAGMKVVWVPDPNLVDTLKNDTEDLDPTQTMASLNDFRPEQWGLPPFET
jgi:pseudouridine-5'-monophosphatase